MDPPVRRWAVPIVFVFLLLFSAAPLPAQRADFLFGRPAVTLAVSSGWAMPGESSPLFTFWREQLTVSRGDFASPFILAEAGIRLTERIDVAGGFEYTGSTVFSEDEKYVTQDDAPIPQTTEFERYRLTGGVKAYLLRRGRAISDFAWVPNRWSPYVGGGVGVTWYDVLQYGDFVDYQTLDIFSRRFSSDGKGFTPYAVAGVDISLSPRFLVRTEVRHLWGSAPLTDPVFQELDHIDLSGFRGTVGFAVRLGGRT